MTDAVTRQERLERNYRRLVRAIVIGALALVASSLFVTSHFVVKFW